MTKKLDFTGMELASPELAPSIEPVKIPQNEPLNFDGMEREYPRQEEAYHETLDSNPDQVGKVMELEKKTGENPAYIEKNLKAVETAVNAPSQEYWDDMRAKYPRASEWISKTQNMAVAKDDIDSLKKFEDDAEEMGLIRMIGRSLDVGLMKMNANIFSTPTFLYDISALPQNALMASLGREDLQVRGKDTPIFKTLEEVSDWYERGAETPGYAPEELSSDIIEEAKNGNYKKASRALLAQIASNAPQQIPILLMSAFGYGNAGLVGMSLTSGADISKRGKDAGAVKSTLSGIIGGTAEGALEKTVGTVAIFKSMTNNLAKTIGKDNAFKVVKDLAKTLLLYPGGEFGEEAGTSIIQDVTSEALNVEPDATEGWLQRALNAGIVGYGSGVSMTFPTASATVIHRSLELRRAEADRQKFLKMGKNASESKLLARSPQALNSAVKEITKGTEVENVYIDVESNEKFFQDEKTTAQETFKALGLEDAFLEAKKTGGYVEVPLADWVSKFVGTPLYNAIGNDIAFSRDDLTVNQIKESQESAKKLMKEEIDSIKDKGKLAEYEKIIHNNMAEQINRLPISDELKKQNIESSKLTSRLYAVQVIKRGQTVAEFIEQGGIPTIQTSKTIGKDDLSQEPLKIQGLENRSEEDIKGFVADHIAQLTENFELEGIDFEVVDIATTGSRTAGVAKEGSDIDVLIEYTGKGREDDFFNALKREGNELEIDGITVDINPIKAEKSGTIAEYKAMHEKKEGKYAEDPLTTEARKYKTAEEFVESQTKSISEKAKKEWSGFKQYNYESTELPVNKIKQREIVNLRSEKFKEIRKAVTRGDRTPIVVNKSNFILDGHHRFNAYKESGANYGTIPVLKVIGKGNGQIIKKEKLTDIWNKAQTLKQDLMPDYAPMFYSKLQQVITDKMGGKAEVNQLKAMLKKNAVKDEEIEWSGINEFLEGKQKVGKQELLDYLKANEVQVEEVVKSEVKLSKEKQERLLELNGMMNRGKLIGKKNKHLVTELRSLQRESESLPGTKFSGYQIEGDKTNYKELLLTFRPIKKEVERFKKPFLDREKFDKLGDLERKKQWGGKLTKEEEKIIKDYKKIQDDYKIETDRYNDLIKKEDMKNATYQSSHFDEKNILAHVRMNDRVVDGKKMLFIEEIQSDWHQAGRKEGYASGKELTAKDAMDMGYSIRRAMSTLGTEAYFIDGVWETDKRIPGFGFDTEAEAWKALLEHIKKNKPSKAVPDAPFKKNWHELALKRMLRYASENNYDMIGWTTGETQAERYDLSKQIDEVYWYVQKNGKYGFSANKDGNSLIEKNNLDKNEIESHLGKDIAKKITESKEDDGTLKGLDLKIGDKGMKGFYDKIIPSAMNKLTKKFGGKVEDIRLRKSKYKIEENEDFGSNSSAKKYIIVDIKNDNVVVESNDKAELEKAIISREKGIEVHSLVLTPELKKTALGTGFPLFQQGEKFRGSYDPVKKIIALGPDADASTLMHELSHDFLANMFDYSKVTGTTVEYDKDWKVISTWLEIKEGQKKLTVAQQETFARGFELYLRGEDYNIKEKDGKFHVYSSLSKESVESFKNNKQALAWVRKKITKSPSKDLKGIFNKFRAWLTEVYQSARQLDVVVSRDVQRTFDRMLSAEGAINSAESAVPTIEALSSPVTAELKKEAHDEAVNILTKRLLEDMTSMRQEEFLNEIADIQASVRESLLQSPPYKALEFLNELFKKGDYAKKFQEYLSSGKNETELSIVADNTFFNSIEDMIQAVNIMKPIEDAVSEAVREVEDRMDASLNPERLKADAEDIITSGDMQLEVLALETNFLRKGKFSKDIKGIKQVLGERLRKEAKIMAEEARILADGLLDDKTIEELRKYKQYATQAKNSALNATRFFHSGDMVKALKHKRSQIANQALYSRASKINRDLQKRSDSLNKIAKKKKDNFKDEDAYFQVSKLLSKFGFIDDRRIEDETTLAEYEEQTNLKFADKDGTIDDKILDFPEWLVGSADKHFSKLTWAEYQDLHDALKSIIYVSNSLDKFYTEGQKATISAIVELMINQIKKQRPKNIKQSVEQGKMDTAKHLAKDYLYSLDGVDMMTQIFDGYEDHGIFQNIFKIMQKHQADKRSNKTLEMKTKLKKVYSDSYTEKEAKDITTKKIFIPELGEKMTKSKILAMALNMGAVENRDKLFNNKMVGIGENIMWDENLVTTVVSKYLNKKDFKYVQSIWDTIGELWDPVNVLQRNLTGFSLGKTKAVPFSLQLQSGESVYLKGGYFPLTPDPRSNTRQGQRALSREEKSKALQDQMRSGSRAMTNKSHTEARTKAQYVPLLDLGMIDSHVKDVVHDLYFRSLVLDLRRILNNDALRTAIKDKYGREAYDAFHNHVNSYATGNSSTKASNDSISQVALFFKKSVSVAFIFGKISVIIQNFANIYLAGNAVEEFGYIDSIKAITLRGLGNYWRPSAIYRSNERSDMLQFVHSKSAFMRDKREVGEYTLAEISAGKLTDRQDYKDFLIGLMSATDDLISVPMWTEAYWKMKKEGKSEQQAIDIADRLAERIASSGRKFDQAGILKGSELQKLFSIFYTFFNAEYSNWYRNIAQFQKDKIGNKYKFMGFLASRALFIYFSTLLRGGVPEDEEEAKGYWWKEFLTYPISFFPGIRDILTPFISGLTGEFNFGYSGVVASSVPSALAQTAYSGGKLAKDITDGQDVDMVRLIEETSKTASLATPYPNQLNIFFWNGYDIYVNDMEFKFNDLRRRRPKRER